MVLRKTLTSNQRQVGMLVVAALLLLAFMVTACSVTRQPRRAVEPSGFLGDYSQLREGKGKEASLVYINPEVDFSKYDAVIIDSVSLWYKEGARRLSDQERQALCDYTYEALHRELGKEYKIVTVPGPGVLRIRAALTEAKGAKVAAKVVAGIVPQIRTISTLGGMAADTALTVGEASMEMDVTDSVTGRRLAAAVDERWGTRAIRGGITKWSDAKNAIDYWADRIRIRTQELRSGAD